MPTFFQMMMKWRHLKNALAFGNLKINDLHDDGQRGPHETNTQNQNEQSHIRKQRYRGNQPAQKQRPCVAHKYRRLLRIE